MTKTKVSFDDLFFSVIVDPLIWLKIVFRSEANKYTPEELMLMKTQDIGYILQKLQSEKKVCTISFQYIQVTRANSLCNILILFYTSISGAENWEAYCVFALYWYPASKSTHTLCWGQVIFLLTFYYIIFEQSYS